jgi:hypothetical protein
MSGDELISRDFDPTKFERTERALGDFVQDTTVLEATFARAEGRAASRVIRCWRCYKQPDGTWDCFKIDCPVSWPQISVSDVATRA